MLKTLTQGLKRFYVQHILPDELSVERHGVRMRLLKSDDVQFAIYRRRYSNELVELIGRLVEPGDTCLDIGANVGFLSLLIAKATGPTGSVHAFEPSPAVYARLVANRELNPWAAHLAVHQVAISSTSGEVCMRQSDPCRHSGWSTVEEFDDVAIDEIVVRAWTLDEFVAEYHIGRVDFAKIDVEAHEFELLAGARRTFGAQLIRRVLIEFNGPRLRQIGRSFAQFLDCFAEHGYVPCPDFNADVLERCRREPDFAERQCTDALFMPLA